MLAIEFAVYRKIKHRAVWRKTRDDWLAVLENESSYWW